MYCLALGSKVPKNKTKIMTEILLLYLFLFIFEFLIQSRLNLECRDYLYIYAHNIWYTYM